jgi:hypothetical protein
MLQACRHGIHFKGILGFGEGQDRSMKIGLCCLLLSLLIVSLSAAQSAESDDPKRVPVGLLSRRQRHSADFSKV